MATDLPRFTITLPDELYEQVSEYQAEQKIKTQSKTIQKLIAIGISTVAEQNGQKGGLEILRVDKNEKSLVTAWRKADDKAKEHVAIELRDYGFDYRKKDSRAAVS